ncbi:MAG: hemolysin, partial [Mucinivorans sp.]
NLWDGLGTIVVRNPDIRYLFGKVTMYGDYNDRARGMLIYFLRKYFPDRDKLISTKCPAELSIDEKEMKAVFTGRDYIEDYRILSRQVRNYAEVIPPLINAYMNLSPTMKVFDTAINHDFGDVQETGILITIGDLYKEKVARHFESEF